MDSDQPFGGKVIVLGGEFCQVLPVVRKGPRPQIVNSSIVNSHCWRYFEQNIVQLSINMCIAGDPQFQQFLLSVGNGEGVTNVSTKIQLPASMVIHGGSQEQNLDQLITQIFQNITSSFLHPDYFLDRAILCCKKISVNQINARILKTIPSEGRTYTSYDLVEDYPQNLYLQEYINSLTISGFP
jgi:ATP-dependent DNA helicase PIF1